MDNTSRAPDVPLNKFKRTKIIATVGPSTNDYLSIETMIKQGVNGLRLNFSHGNNEERLQQLKWIRQASHELSKPVAIIQDLQGPKIRLGDFEGIINVNTNQDLRFGYNADFERSNIIPTQYDLSKYVKRGERLYLCDGRIRTIVSSVNSGIVHVLAQNDGILLKRKSINLPDTDLSGDIITAKDRQDITFGSEQDIDYVALSFIQSAADIEHLRKLMKGYGSKARIIAKIETAAAVANIEEIVQAADVIMIARGDLAIETEPEAVPIVQRNIIRLGLRYAKPTIVATQMLSSMTETPEPSRAEVSDVATAVILSTDAVMLSDETANGRYPIESVNYMKRVIKYTEENNPIKVGYRRDPHEHTRQSTISSAIIELAKNVNASAIVAETKSGATTHELASFRPEIAIIAVTPDKRTSQQLSIVYGTKSYVRPADKNSSGKLTDWLKSNKVLKKGDIVVSVYGQYPGVVGSTDTIKVRIL